MNENSGMHDQSFENHELAIEHHELAFENHELVLEHHELPFENRIAAGRLLALCLQAGRPLVDPLVMALPPGGVPVALEVARALEAELDLIMVRRLGMPGQSELAMGAVAGGGIRLRNNPVIREAEVGEKAFRRSRSKIFSRKSTTNGSSSNEIHTFAWSTSSGRPSVSR